MFLTVVVIYHIKQSLFIICGISFEYCVVICVSFVLCPIECFAVIIRSLKLILYFVFLSFGIRWERLAAILKIININVVLN